MGRRVQIGIVGAGLVGTTIARFVAVQGHQVLLANRTGGEGLTRVAASVSGDVAAASTSEAFSCDLVILAVPWPNAIETLKEAPAWEGRILVDATNPYIRHTPPLELDDMQGESASVRLAEHATDARVVKAFNLPMVNFAKGAVEGDARRVLFVSGDDEAAKARVKGLIATGGFVTVDLGGLDEGGRMQQAGGSLAGIDFLIANTEEVRVRPGGPRDRS